MNKDLKKVSKEKLISELSRAHLMIVLLAVGVGLLAYVNSVGTSLFSDMLTYGLVVLCVLIAGISTIVFVRISLKK